MHLLSLVLFFGAEIKSPTSFFFQYKVAIRVRSNITPVEHLAVCLTEREAPSGVMLAKDYAY